MEPGQTLIFHLQQTYRGVQIRSAYADMAQLRMIKRPEEMDVMRRACALTAKGITEAAKAVREGVDERSLEAVLEAAFKRGGGQRVAFDAIIAAIRLDRE